MNNFIYNYILSDIGRVLWDSFENHPEEWECSDSGATIENHSKEIALWIGNGASFFDGWRYFLPTYDHERKYPSQKIELGLIERHFLYYKFYPIIKTSTKDNIIERFKE